MEGVIHDADVIDAELMELEARKPYRPIFLTDNAITLAGHVQLVIRFYGSPELIHQNFDYVHCTNYWTSADRKLTTNIEAMESIMSKELKYIGSRYPVCSVIRMRKFFRRGWWMNAGQMLKVMLQLSALDLTRIEVLEDQLTGVDTAYFFQLINRLKKDKDQMGKVDSIYIVSIIDKMFG